MSDKGLLPDVDDVDLDMPNSNNQAYQRKDTIRTKPLMARKGSTGDLEEQPPKKESSKLLTQPFFGQHQSKEISNKLSELGNAQLEPSEKKTPFLVAKKLKQVQPEEFKK